MRKIGEIVVREVREALPPFIFFLFLFHMLALTKAVLLGDYSITALRAATTTVGALIVAKAILAVEALPVGRMFSGRGVFQVVWKTGLFAIAALLFRFAEEVIPLASKHGGALAGTRALFDEIVWPVFWVESMWIVGGLLLYCMVKALVDEIGGAKARQIFFGRRGGDRQPA